MEESSTKEKSISAQIGELSGAAGSSPAPDRRLDTRFAFTEIVRVYKADGSNRMYEGLCKDLSLGGVGIQLEGDLAVGEVVELGFDATERRQQARVMFRSSNRYGLSFLK